MSIQSVKSGTESVSAVAAVRPAGDGPDFAALAASLSRGDLAGARAAVGNTAPHTRNEALHASVVEGNLAAARVMLGLDAGAAAAGTPTNSGHAPESSRPVGKREVNTHTADPIPDKPAASAPVARANANVVDVGSLAEPAQDVDVAAVMRALATGNAGNIPAEVINRYGPGGALYDPAAIMDAYRASSLGHAQMSAMDWIGKPV